MTRKILWLIIILVYIGCSPTHKMFIVSDIEHSFKKDSSFLIHKNQIKNKISFILNENKIDDNLIKNIYSKNNFEPLWFNLIRRNNTLEILKDAYKHGLNPKDYYVDTINSLINTINNNNIFNIRYNTSLDLFLTKGIILYTNHLLNGKVNPNKIYSEWNYKKDVFYNKDSLILHLIKEDSIFTIDKVFEPKTLLYENLKNELQKYINIQEADILNTPLYFNKTYQLGDTNKQIFELKTYLYKYGYLKKDNINYLFDLNLKNAIKHFQLVHGLTPDGILGNNTYNALKWSPQKHINKIKINMERCRWMPLNTPDTLIVINIPEYKIKLYKSNKILFYSKVIVGKLKTKTPTFCSKVDRIVFNPCWTVPNSIATKKILPRIKKDSTYLDRHNMFVRKQGVDQVTDSIDFNNYSKNNFPFKIYQRSCSTNALGKVKFLFNNKHQIYMHDTHSKSLFNKKIRTFSSGCIRLENPLSLAKIILYKIDRNKTPISKYLSKSYPIVVKLKHQIPIFITYSTCIYKDNNIIFIDDVYNKDYKILKMINQKQ